MGIYKAGMIWTKVVVNGIELSQRREDEKKLALNFVYLRLGEKKTLT